MTHQYHNLRDSINVASTPAKRDYVMAEVTEIFKQYSESLITVSELSEKLFDFGLYIIRIGAISCSTLRDEEALMRWINHWAPRDNGHASMDCVTAVCDDDKPTAGHKMVAHVSCYRDTPEVIDLQSADLYHNGVCTSHFFIINC